MEGWNNIEIGSIFKFTSGKSRPKNTQKGSSSELNIPVFGGNGILGYTDQVFIDKKVIILGRVGEYCGCTHIFEGECWISDNALYTKEVKTDCNLDFAKYCLEQKNLNQYSNKMGQPLITQGIINEITLSFPPLPEQRKIAYVLGTVQKAIEKQDRLIKTTTELKKALMQKLFTEGLYGESQKETEIGLVPESWEVVRFPKFTLLQRGKDLTKKNFQEGQVPVAGSSGIIGFHNQSFVRAPSVTVGRSGSCGNVCFYENDFWAHNTSLYVKDFNGNDELFSFYYLQYLDLGRFKTGVSVPTLDRNALSTFQISVPKRKEQIEIAKTIRLVEQKIENHNKKKQTLTALFKTLLHELMTGQRKVHEIDFEKQKEELLMAAEPKMEYNK